LQRSGLRLSVVAALLLLAATSRPALADPYRLRGDVFVSARPPVGLLVLQAEDHTRPWLDAEALVWAGGGDDNTAEALVIAVRVRDPGGRGEARAGRLVLATGAVRPIHIDGVIARARLPQKSSVELFTGSPVASRFGARSFDWLAGTRVSHAREGLGTVGASFIHEHGNGQLLDEEVGVDVAATPRRWLDIASRASYDLVSPGISDAQLSAVARRRSLRAELFASRRSPSRMLPPTSLFSALGDVPSDELGTAFRWRAAPRLDIRGTAAARLVGGDLGANLSTRATLRLDDRGKGALAVDGRWQSAPDASWSGVRTSCRLPIASAITASAEVELVIPHDSGDRGRVWPWGLAAVGWRYGLWEAAAAVEGGASPENEAELSALFRLARRWGAK